jgi:hypothetical protein
MIATLAEVKTLLQITDTTKDALITALQPIIQSEILEECRSNFETTAYKSDGSAYEGGETISFVSSTKTIADSAGGLPFLAGQNVYISGSKFNDGHYTVVTASAISFTVNEVIFDEAIGSGITIKLVKFPTALKAIYSDYIGVKITKREIGVTSESVPGGFSKSYSNDGGSMPEGIKKRLQKFVCLRIL